MWYRRAAWWSCHDGLHDQARSGRRRGYLASGQRLGMSSCEDGAWTEVVRPPRSSSKDQNSAAQPFVPHEGMRRRYLNLIAEHLEKSGPCELGALGNLFPQPAELRNKKLKDMLCEADDVFSLVVFKSSGWAVRLKRVSHKSALRVASAGGRTNPRLIKTKLCLDWQLKGRCERGGACWFAHGTTELKAAPDCKTTCFMDKEEHGKPEAERAERPACEPRAASHVPTHAEEEGLIAPPNWEEEPRVIDSQAPAAYQKQLWSQLNESEQNAAATLGYDEYYWEHGLTPTTCTFKWKELATDERSAACLLGYCEQSWNDELDKCIVPTVTTLTNASPLIEHFHDSKSQTTEDTHTEHAGDDVNSSSSTDAAGTLHRLSCKAKADEIRAELGLSANLPIPAVVKQGFELVGDQLPSGGLVKQVSTLYAILFEG